MGRGVATVGDNSIYFDVCDMLQDEDAWDDLRENLQAALSKAFPSLDVFRDWRGNECRGVLKNSFVQVYISEYRGCGAISVVTDDSEYPELAEAWIAKVWERFTKIVGEYTDTLRHIATGSNGIPLFERI